MFLFSITTNRCGVSTNNAKNAFKQIQFILTASNYAIKPSLSKYSTNMNDANTNMKTEH